MRSKIAIFLLAAFLVGIGVGYICFSDKRETYSKIVHTKNILRIYSFTKDRNNNEIKDGWEYLIYADGLNEERIKFKDGVKVYSETSFRYDSEKNDSVRK